MKHTPIIDPTMPELGPLPPALEGYTLQRQHHYYTTEGSGLLATTTGQQRVELKSQIKLTIVYELVKEI